MTKETLLKNIETLLYQSDGRMIRGNRLQDQEVVQLIQDIKKYLNFDSTELHELVFRVQNDIQGYPKCPECGKSTHWLTIKRKYSDYCSDPCMFIGKGKNHKGLVMSEEAKQKLSEHAKARTSNPMTGRTHSEESKKKMSEKKKGWIRPQEHIEKWKATMIAKGAIKEKTGIRCFVCNRLFPKLKGIKKHLTLHHPEISLKEKVDFFHPEQKEKKCVICDKPVRWVKSGYYADTCEDTFCINANATENIRATKRKNKSYGKSISEDIFFNKINRYNVTIKRQYKSDVYPFSCDFYIVELDLYIEFQGFWSHGPEPFDATDEEHIKIKQKYESINKPLYKSALSTWVEADPRKRKVAQEQGLNFIEVWPESETEKAIIEDLSYYGLKETITEPEFERVGLNIEQLLKEQSVDNCDRHINIPASFTSVPHQNFYIQHYYPNFYAKEIEMLKNPEVVAKLQANRLERIGKSLKDMTPIMILRGLTQMGLTKSYSFSNSALIKAFIDKYKPTAIYDPFGGWGHRLMGAWNVPYIYNDLNKQTYEGSKKIFENWKDRIPASTKTFYNQDASTFTPTEDYDAVFTCPPYYDTEDYGFPYPRYREWLKWWEQSVICSFINKPTAKIFAYTIGSKYREDMNKVCESLGLELVEQIPIHKTRSHFDSKKLSYEEIQIYRKPS